MIRKLQRIGEYRTIATYSNFWKILTYKARGRKGRVSRTFKMETIIDNPGITQHVKRNRIYQLIYNSIING